MNLKYKWSHLPLLLFIIVFAIGSVVIVGYSRNQDRPAPIPLQTLAWEQGEVGVYDYGGNLGYDYSIEWRDGLGEAALIRHLGYAWDISLRLDKEGVLLLHYRTVDDKKAVERDLRFKSLQDAKEMRSPK